MIINSPAPSLCGERQLAYIEKRSSGGAGFALYGRSATSQGRKLAPFPKSTDKTGRVRPVVSLRVGGASAPLGCKQMRRDDPIPRRMAAFPRVGQAGLMDPNPVATTVFPNDGAYHVSNS